MISVASVQMRAWPSVVVLLSFVGSALAGDPLKELGQFLFCKDKTNGTMCDAMGARQCWGEECMSACSALDTAREKFSQCACPGSSQTAAGCELCCSSHAKGCQKAAALLPENASLSGRSKGFCYERCPWGGTGRTCVLDSSVGTMGMCHRGRCRDPCQILSGSLFQCSGTGSCADIGAQFCCKEEGAADTTCRVEDKWHARLKSRLQKNNGASGLAAASALLAAAAFAALRF